LSEIRVTAHLQHPHILPLFDSGQAGGLIYYVMPHVEGESLRQRLEREKELPIEEALTLATSVAGALDYAHRHGVIHRAGGGGPVRSIYTLSLQGPRTPQLFLANQFDNHSPSMSPDGRWVAYVSNESGRLEVYVRPFPGPGGRWQVSLDGGSEPLWAPNGGGRRRT